MEEFNDSDENIETFLSQYKHIKKAGVKCPIEEARTWYLGALRLSQENLKLTSYGLGVNLNQRIGYHNLSQMNKDLINDDLECIVEQAIIFKELFNLVTDLYKNKNNYNAWKLEIELPMGEILGEDFESVKTITYYAEPKSASNDKNLEVMYI